MEPFTPIGHPAFFMGAGLAICVLFVLEPFTPIGHKAFFMGAGLPLLYLLCVLDVVGGGPWPGTTVAISCSQCLEVTGPRPAPNERSESKHVDLMHAFKLFARWAVGLPSDRPHCK